MHVPVYCWLDRVVSEFETVLFDLEVYAQAHPVFASFCQGMLTLRQQSMTDIRGKT